MVAVLFGCEYCADDENRWFGHVTQVGSDERRQMILLRCPRCRSLYESAPHGDDRTRRLTEDEARALFPNALWRCTRCREQALFEHQRGIMGAYGTRW